MYILFEIREIGPGVLAVRDELRKTLAPPSASASEGDRTPESVLYMCVIYILVHVAKDVFEPV